MRYLYATMMLSLAACGSTPPAPEKTPEPQRVTYVQVQTKADRIADLCLPVVQKEDAAVKEVLDLAGRMTASEMTSRAEFCIGMARQIDQGKL